MRLKRSDPDLYPRACAVLGRAFSGYPLMVHACPDESLRLAAVTMVYRAIIDDCLRYGEVYAAPSISGVACWLPPASATVGFWRQLRSGMLALPFYFGLTGLRTLTAYDGVGQRLHHDHATMPHYHLAAIGVDPERQGQGVSRILMQPMLDRADQQQLHCWLDTHREENVRLYQRYGFEICERVDVPGHPVPMWGMLRPPRR